MGRGMMWVSGVGGSCVGLTSDFSANGCIITSIYMWMWSCKFITTLASSSSVVTHVLCMVALSVFLFSTLWTCFVRGTFFQNRPNVLVRIWYYLVSAGSTWMVKLSEQRLKKSTSWCTCLILTVLHWSLYLCLCECVSDFVTCMSPNHCPPGGEC